MNKINFILLLTVGFGAHMAAGKAVAYSARVNSACKTDFRKFCPSHKSDSPQLRACMRSAGGNISSRCLDALADSGEIPRNYHSRYRK